MKTNRFIAAHAPTAGRTSRLKLGVAVLALMGGACLNAPVFAAEEGGEGDSAVGLEEIVVTSTKRNEGLQDIPMSVSAISSLELDRMGATEFFDYATKVPNLGFGYEADGRFDSRKIGIRGIFGAGQTSIGGTTGFYIDETPVPETMNPRVLDVERIEVLRGPQGTLYGARSMGGTIRLISKQPSFDGFEGRAHAKLSTVRKGDINWSFDGAVNIPVIEDKVAVRVLGYYADNSGIYDRLSIPGTPGPSFVNKNVDDEKYYGAQISAAIRVTDTLTFTPRFMYQRVEADGFPFADIQTNNYQQFRYFNIEEPGTDEWWLTSGTLNWALEFGSITSSTAYFDRAIDENEDETAVLPFFIPVVPPAPAPIEETVDFRAFVHETRFTSDFDSPFQVTAGVFYQRTNQFLQYPPALYPGLGAAIGAPPFFNLVFQTDNRFSTRELAAFGEASYDFTDWLKGTIGGRWSKTKVKFFRIAAGLVTDFVPDPNFFLDGGAGTDGVDFAALQANPPAGGIPTLDNGRQSESSFNPKFVLEAKVDEDVKVYTSAAKGFRIGGVNATVPALFCADDLATLNLGSLDEIATYNSDSVWSYEVGLKSKFADNRVTVNAAVFRIDWTNLQINNRLSCGFQFVANGGKARSKGFEVEIQAAPVEGLFLTLSAGYTNAKIRSVPSLATGVAPGDPIQQVPDWNVAATTQYYFPLTETMDGFVRTDFNYYGRSFSANNEPTNPRLRPSWALINLRAGVTKDMWEVTLFADNVTNTRANLADNRSIAAEVGGRPRIVSNRPRTIGLEARARF
jgi:outer membrane receptor protein involved in Fe transport